MPTMKLIALSMVKDESDIVEVFVRHALRLFDEMVLVDNGSTDGTREILSQLQRDGSALTVIDDPRADRAQSDVMTRLLHETRNSRDCDYMAFLDADEFVGVKSRTRLEASLDRLPEDHFGLVPWRTHVLRPDDAEGPENPILRMRWRRRKEEPPYDKVIVPAHARWIANAVVANGNHAMHDRVGRALPSAPLEDLVIRHFPVRSAAQVRTKVINGWLAYRARELTGEHVRKDQGSHWASIFDRIVQQGLTDIDVFRVSANYAQQRNLLEPTGDQDLVEDPIEFVVDATIAKPPTDPMRPVARQAEAIVRIGLEALAANRRLSAELADARDEVDRSHGQIQILETNLTRTTRQRDEVTASTSWRITAPLRRLGRLSRHRR